MNTRKPGPARTLIGILALAGAARSQPGASRPAPRTHELALIKKRNEKLALPFLRQADWITDYDRARAEARRTGKPIFAYFSRSYAG